MADTAAATAAAAPPQRGTNALLEAPILPTLLRLTLPNLAAMVVVTLVAICETVYVGMLGTVPLAAIALVFPMIMLMQMLSAGAMGGGVSSAISRALGAGDMARANALAVHAVAIGAAAGLFFSVVFLAFGAPIFRALGGSGAVLDEALAYANIALTGAILTWLLNTFASIVRGTGNMRVPSLDLARRIGRCRSCWAALLGLGIGPIPRLGVAGVAAGLVIAYAGATLFLLWFLCAGRGQVTLRLDPAPPQPRDVPRHPQGRRRVRPGPVHVVLTVLILTRLVAGFGTEALAGYGIGARLEFLLVPHRVRHRRGLRAHGRHGDGGAARSSARGRWRGPPPASPWPRWASSVWWWRCCPTCGPASSPPIRPCAPPPISICAGRGRGLPSSAWA